MQLRYNYRLYPTPGQQVALARAFGCARVVFNDGLRARQEAFAAGLPYITDAELSARLTAAKKTLERAWLTEVSSVVLQQALVDLNAAYRNFFASVSGTRKGPKIAPPRFRSRTKDAAGRYVASFVVGTEPGALPETQPVLGIDLGLAHFAVLSDGRKIASPHFLRRVEKKLRRAQRDLSRKQGGSRNRDKARIKVARAHPRVADARRDFKARLYGRKFHRIGRFEPTSQMCSACGVKDGPKRLHVRIWQCQRCGVSLDRDVNAAVDVARAAGLAVTACGAQVRPGPALAQCGEAGTHPKPRREPV